jgi:regulator of sirC expression with transglutaminase-like and TPR domain
MSAEEFCALMKRPEHRINVAEAALIFARELQSGVDVPHYMNKIDALAGQVRERLSRAAGPEMACLALSRFLFDELEYRGNAKHYHDPLNSYLNEVIDRRLGIPITLVTLYIEVGRRAGLPLCGVGFPGHFLARHTGAGTIIDCFGGGRILSRADCTALLREIYGSKAKFDARYLVPARPRETIVRMLSNLKFSYIRGEAYDESLRVIHLIDAVWPNLAENIRDRGLVELALEQFPIALRDLQEYARLAPKAPDREEIFKRIQQLKRALAKLN